MMNKLLVVGIVGVLIVAGFLFLFSNTEGGDDVNGTATIFVESELGDVGSMEMDIGAPTMSEQMMMSIGQGIRGEDFMLQEQADDPNPGSPTPYPITGIAKALKYNVWMTAKITVSGTNILNNALIGSSVQFRSGNADRTIYYTASTGSTTATLTNKLVLNSATTVDQSTVGKWSYIESGTTTTALLGSDLDGMTLSIAATATAKDTNGNTIGFSVSASIVLDVTSYVADGTLKASITDINVGKTQLSMMNLDASTMLMEEMKCEA